MPKAKLKRPITLAPTSMNGTPYDRRTSDLLRNACVAPVVVDDPLEAGAKLVVLRSLRDDPLAAMHNAKQLDDAQFMAGRHWQQNQVMLEIGGARAIDPGKPAVDGGPVPGQSKLSDSKIKAFKEMSQAIRALGIEGGALIQMFLDQGLTLKAISFRWGARTDRDCRYVGKRLREALDTLAVVFGYARNLMHKEPQDEDFA